jgi:DNA polymerase-1
LDQRCDALVKDIQKQTKDDEFNPRSPKQVVALMENIGITPVAYTESGNASWDREAMLEVRDQHPIPMNIAKYRALKYQRSGHVERALTAIELHHAIMHFEFKNWGTVTGRLSGNSQQMPKGWLQFGEEGMGEELLVWAKGDLAVERDFSIRRLHKPREGHVLIVADYKQIEMFVLGYFINDPTFTKWLDSGNVHAAVALDVWGIDADHREFQIYYDRGKVFNFANVYGQGLKALAAANGWTFDQAQQYQQDYSNRMPGLQKYRMQVQRALRRDGFVVNEFLREYHGDPQLAYKFVNYVVQGSSGDHVKWKLTETRELRRQLKCHTLNTTHDDFVFELPIENVDGIPDLLKILRKSPFKRDLELDVEYSLENLVELHPYKEGMTIAA